MKINFNYYDEMNYPNTILDQLDLSYVDERIIANKKPWNTDPMLLKDFFQNYIKETFNNDQRFFEHDSIYSLANIINPFFDANNHTITFDIISDDVQSSNTFNIESQFNEAVLFAKEIFDNHYKIKNIATDYDNHYDIFIPNDRQHVKITNMNPDELSFIDIYTFLRYSQLFLQNKLFLGRQIRQLDSIEIIYD